MLSGALCLSLSAFEAAAVIAVSGDGEEERTGTAAAAAAATRASGGDLGPGGEVGRIETADEEKGEEMRAVRRERMAVNK